MGLNRFLFMSNTSGIKAFLIIAYKKVGFSNRYGYEKAQKYGSISPNPLPNGTEITELYYTKSTNRFYVEPTNVTVTINGVQIRNSETNVAILDYMMANVGKTIPIIFQFD